MSVRVLLLRHSAGETLWLLASLKAQGHEIAEAELNAGAIEGVRTWTPQVVVVTMSPRHVYVRDIIQAVHGVDPLIRVVVACDVGLEGLEAQDLSDLDVEGGMRLAEGPARLEIWVHVAARAWRLRQRERRRRDMCRALMEMLNGQAAEIARLRSRVAEDDLTGVFTRDAFHKAAVTALQVAVRNGGNFALAILDVDHFKRINDAHGHLVGDRVLRDVAATMRNALRPGDFVGRFGGDEFLIGLRDTDGQTAASVLQRVRACLEKRVCVGVRQVTFSCGVSALLCNSPGAAVRLDDEGAARILRKMLTAADRSLYRAKAHGRNRVMVDTDMELSTEVNEVGAAIRTA